MDLPIPDDLKNEWLMLASRRQFLSRAGKSLAWASIASLFAKGGHDLQAAEAHQALLPHFAPKAKRAIYLFMAGAPSRSRRWITSRSC